MASRFLKNLLSIRLFRPVFIVLVVAGLAQVVISQWLISDQVERLIGVAGLSPSLTLVAVSSMVVLLMLVAAVLGGGVLPRVLRLNSAIRSIADGEADLTRRVNMKGNDELTKMARSVNQFIARIQELVSDVKRRGLCRQFSCKAVYGPPGTPASVLRPELQR